MRKSPVKATYSGRDRFRVVSSSCPNARAPKTAGHWRATYIPFRPISRTKLALNPCPTLALRHCHMDCHMDYHTDSATDLSTTPSHKVSIKEPEAPKMIYHFGHSHCKLQAWQIGPLERAAIAAAITASCWKGRRLLARQTSNQRHSETLLVQRAKLESLGI